MTEQSVIIEFVDELPPTTRGKLSNRGYDHYAIAEELRKNPGKWAKTNLSPNFVYKINNLFHPAYIPIETGIFEAVCRNNSVYLRYNETR